jgi:phenylacetate-CoA oxygenase PaaJ subunit
VVAAATSDHDLWQRAWDAAASVTDPEIPVLTIAGIAPPMRASSRRALFGVERVDCPQCGSGDTELLSEFGSTSCKALWRCKACREPFDYFKCH